MDYYVFTRPNAMVGHKYTDDVALVKANSKTEAIEKFSRYYADIEDSEVYKLDENRADGMEVHILTDY